MHHIPVYHNKSKPNYNANHPQRYFLVRKSDGKIPRKFIRNLSSDFDKVSLAGVTFIECYYSNDHLLESERGD